MEEVKWIQGLDLVFDPHKDYSLRPKKTMGFSIEGAEHCKLNYRVKVPAEIQESVDVDYASGTIYFSHENYTKAGSYDIRIGATKPDGTFASLRWFNLILKSPCEVPSFLDIAELSPIVYTLGTNDSFGVRNVMMDKTHKQYCWVNRSM